MKVALEKNKENHFALEVIINERLNLLPIKSTTKIQDEVDEENIFKLYRLGGGKYIAVNVADKQKTETPRGRWLFVVTTEDPCNVIMISEDRINKTLLSSSFTGATGIGHTSLSRKYSALDDTFRSRPYIKERMRIANRLNRKATHYALDVYLAGEILFNDTGVMSEWDNNSGHYRLSAEIALSNIPSPVRSILPGNLFKKFNA